MVENKKVYELTEEGKKKLEERLDYLKNTARKENIIAIQDARSQGDLSENADYSAAREEQARIEAEIAQTEEILQHCKVINNHDNSDTISLGKHVKLVINGVEREFSIVSRVEVDPRNGKISNESPLGSNIIGHRPGDVVRFRTESDNEVVAEIKAVSLGK